MIACRYGLLPQPRTSLSPILTPLPPPVIAAPASALESRILDAIRSGICTAPEIGRAVRKRDISAVLHRMMVRGTLRREGALRHYRYFPA